MANREIERFFSSLLGVPRRVYGERGEAQFFCPFHIERNPSFFVNLNTGVWYCFGCGRGGNLFEFYREYFKEYGRDAFRRFLSFCEREGIEVSGLGDFGDGFRKRVRGGEDMGKEMEGRVMESLAKVATYAYVGLDGREYYLKHRYRGYGRKFFKIEWKVFEEERRKTFFYNVNGLLPFLKKRVLLFFTEGEKDALNLMSSLKGGELDFLFSFLSFEMGNVADYVVLGYVNFETEFLNTIELFPEVEEVFLNAEYFIFCDNDEKGEKNLRKIFEFLRRFLKESKVIGFCKFSSFAEGYDVSDFLEDLKKGNVGANDLLDNIEFYKTSLPFGANIFRKEISLLTLLSEEEREEAFYIRDFLPKNALVLFAGAPKIGKSWFLLNLLFNLQQKIYALDEEKKFLDFLIEKHVADLKVLYLLLDTDKKSFRSRLSVFTSEPTYFQNVYILDREIDLKEDFDSLVSLIKEEGYKLVIFDPIALAFPKEKVMRDSPYVMEANLMKLFKDLIKKTDSTLILVHHTRKAERGEASVDDPIGTRAFVGFADVIWVLKYHEERDLHELWITGKNVSRRRLALSCKEFHFHSLGEFESLFFKAKAKKVLSAIRILGPLATFKNLLNFTKLSETTLARILRKLQEDGYIEKTTSSLSKRGCYRLVEKITEEGQNEERESSS